MFSAGFGGYLQVFWVAFPPVLLPHRFVTSATFPGSWHLSLGFYFIKGSVPRETQLLTKGKLEKYSCFSFCWVLPPCPSSLAPCSGQGSAGLVLLPVTSSGKSLAQPAEPAAPCCSWLGSQGAAACCKPLSITLPAADAVTAGAQGCGAVCSQSSWWLCSHLVFVGVVVFFSGF